MEKQKQEIHTLINYNKAHLEKSYMLTYNREVIFPDKFFFKLKLIVHDIHKQISKLHQKCYRNVSIKITKNFIQTSKIIIFTLMENNSQCEHFELRYST